MSPPYLLDGVERHQITAFLFHAGGDADPERLAANSGIAYSGVKHYGDGFLFEDGKPAATPVAEMTALISEHPDCNSVIRPFIGGDEVNSSPTHRYHRFIINFGVRPEAEARGRWPELLKIVEAKVRPERQNKARDVAAWPWWQFWRPRLELYGAIGGKERVFVNSAVSAWMAFVALPSRWVFSHALNVYALDTLAAFCTLQSRPHEIWARFFGSSLEDRLRYNPSDCFETFALPGELAATCCARSGWQGLLRLSGRAHGQERPGLDQDLQPLSRSR